MSPGKLGLEEQKLEFINEELKTWMVLMDKLYGVEKAISPKQEAVSLTPDSHPDKPGWLSNLGTSVQSRFERLGDVKDLESAISFQQAAIHLTPDGHPDRPGRLNRLGRQFHSTKQRLTLLQMVTLTNLAS